MQFRSRKEEKRRDVKRENWRLQVPLVFFFLLLSPFLLTCQEQLLSTQPKKIQLKSPKSPRSTFLNFIKFVGFWGCSDILTCLVRRSRLLFRNHERVSSLFNLLSVSALFLSLSLSAFPLKPWAQISYLYWMACLRYFCCFFSCSGQLHWRNNCVKRSLYVAYLWRKSDMIFVIAFPTATKTRFCLHIMHRTAGHSIVKASLSF